MTPIKQVAECVLQALMKLEENVKNLKEIHIVDTKPKNITDFQKRFTEHLPDIPGSLKVSTSHKTTGDMMRKKQNEGNLVNYPAHPGAVQVTSVKEFEKMLSHGTIIQVYQGDITKVQVDVIVNAANERLDHIGGVAYAIMMAAGRELQEESEQYVKQNGDIPVSKYAVTGSGKLPCNKVIHSVGPAWSGFKPSEEKDQLINTFINSFKCADEEIKARTMAVPPISSGMYSSVFQNNFLFPICHRDISQCTLIYYRSVWIPHTSGGRLCS